MSPRRRTRSTGIVAVVVAVVLGLAVSCNGFREDEVGCEQALVRLHDCCPDFNTKPIDCSYHENLDCSDRVTSRSYPALSLDDSVCIQNKSCSDLIGAGVCGRAKDAKPRLVQGASGSAPAARVCLP